MRNNLRFAPLPRVAIFIVTLFICASLIAPLPFVVLQPGSGVNVLDSVIKVEGAPTYSHAGKLLLMTVLVTSPSSPIFGANIIYAWAKGDLIVLPRNLIYPATQNSVTINAANKADMVRSQVSATSISLNYLGYPKNQQKVKVAIILKDTGGPSGGLIFTLGIISKLSKQDFLAGRIIAGTGEILAGGKIGPIGGIAEKLVAARRAGATVFLAPADNCQDIHQIPKGLTVYSVATLGEAVSLLKDSSKAIPHCTWQRIR